MKVLYLSLGAMALILAYSLWAGFYVQDQTDKWSLLLEQAAQAAETENWAQAESLLIQARRGWEHSQTYFHTIIEHSELNEVQILFAAAAEECTQQDTREFSAQIVLLRVQLQLLAETQSVSIKNIF